MFAAMSAMNAKVLFNGALSTSSASSPVTSASRTVTRAGTIQWANVFTDSGTPQYSKNGAAYANIVDGATLALALGDTLQVKAVLATPGFQANWDIKRAFGGQLTEHVVLSKT